LLYVDKQDFVDIKSVLCGKIILSLLNFYIYIINTIYPYKCKTSSVVGVLQSFLTKLLSNSKQKILKSFKHR